MKCEQCGSDMRYIKGGISKRTNKPYNAFYSCEDCKITANASEWESRNDQKNHRESDAVAKMREWAENTTQIMRSLSSKISNLEDMCADQQKRIQEMETKMEAQRTLLVELRGEKAVELHESFQPQNVAETLGGQVVEEEIPIIGQ